MNRPQPQILTIWRITLTSASMVPAFLVSLFLRAGSAAWTVSIAVLSLTYLLLFLVYLPLLYEKTSYSVSEKKIIYTTGVLYSRVISAPVSAVQFVSVSQSAVSRVFGLAAVVAVLAGGRVIIPGLALADAKSVAKIIQARSGGEGGPHGKI